MTNTNLTSSSCGHHRSMHVLMEESLAHLPSLPLIVKGKKEKNPSNMSNYETNPVGALQVTIGRQPVKDRLAVKLLQPLWDSQFAPSTESKVIYDHRPCKSWAERWLGPRLITNWTPFFFWFDRLPVPYFLTFNKIAHLGILRIVRDSPTRISTSISFSLIESAWATDQWVKIFSILVKISRSNSNFRF